MVCTECGATVLVGQQVIIGVEVAAGRRKFGFSCIHKQVGWACVDRPAGVSLVLGSLVCVERWLRAHPEHQAEIEELIGSARHARRTADGLERGLERKSSAVS